jgi:hypothetical protein
MKQWKSGLRIGLPVIVEQKSEEGIVNSPGILDLASGFGDANAGWLTQPAGAQETHDDSQIKEAAKNFLAEKPDPTARGYGLARRALTNAEQEQRFILECLAQMTDTDRLNAAIWFMDLVGDKTAVLSAQGAGVAILDGIRAIVAKAPPSKDPRQQEDTARATQLLQRGRDVEIALAKRDWPTILPRVVRGQKQHIQKVSGKLELNIPEVPVRELNETEKGIVQQIRDARAALPPPSDKLTVRPWKTDPKAGYFYAGSDQAAGKAAAQGDQRRQEVMSAINDSVPLGKELERLCGHQRRRETDCPYPGLGDRESGRGSRRRNIRRSYTGRRHFQLCRRESKGGLHLRGRAVTRGYCKRILWRSHLRR